MKTAKVLALALAMLSISVFQSPMASARCHGKAVRHHHRSVSHRRVIRRSIAYAAPRIIERRIIERRIIQPVVQREIVQPVVMARAERQVVAREMIATPVCRTRHHLLNLDTPILGVHLF
jgi:hypothetical protein